MLCIALDRPVAPLVSIFPSFFVVSVVVWVYVVSALTCVLVCFGRVLLVIRSCYFLLKYATRL